MKKLVVTLVACLASVAMAAHHKMPPGAAPQHRAAMKAAAHQQRAAGHMMHQQQKAVMHQQKAAAHMMHQQQKQTRRRPRGDARAEVRQRAPRSAAELPRLVPRASPARALQERVDGRRLVRRIRLPVLLSLLHGGRRGSWRGSLHAWRGRRARACRGSAACRDPSPRRRGSAAGRDSAARRRGAGAAPHARGRHRRRHPGSLTIGSRLTQGRLE